MNRQYIGARYVPKIYQNSVNPNSADWEENTSYEPLTNVTYRYSTYTSKIPVPASVGNPADNPQYWVETGQYNGQIADLQNRVSAVEDEVTDLNDMLFGNFQNFSNRKFAFHSDSYMGFITTELLPMMGLTTSDIVNVGNGTPGGGFVQVGSDSNTFVTDMTNESVHEDVTDLIIIGGQNDAYGGQSASDVATAMDNYFTVARTKFPKATFYFIPCQHITDTTVHATAYLNLLPTFKTKCAENRVKYYENAPYIVTSLAFTSSDRQHLSHNGGLNTSKYIINALLGGDIDVDDYSVRTIENYNITGTPTARLNTSNSIARLTIKLGNSAGAFEFSESKTVGNLINTLVQVATLSDIGGLVCDDFDSNTGFFPILVAISGGSSFNAIGKFVLKPYGKLYISLFSDSQSHSADTIQYIQIHGPITIENNIYTLC